MTPSLEGEWNLGCDVSSVEIFFQLLENHTP
jgi:hypothetical protein